MSYNLPKKPSCVCTWVLHAVSTGNKVRGTYKGGWPVSKLSRYRCTRCMTKWLTDWFAVNSRCAPLTHLNQNQYIRSLQFVPFTRFVNKILLKAKWQRQGQRQRQNQRRGLWWEWLWCCAYVNNTQSLIHSFIQAVSQYVSPSPSIDRWEEGFAKKSVFLNIFVFVNETLYWRFHDLVGGFSCCTFVLICKLILLNGSFGLVCMCCCCIWLQVYT